MSVLVKPGIPPGPCHRVAASSQLEALRTISISRKLPSPDPDAQKWASRGKRLKMSAM